MKKYMIISAVVLILFYSTAADAFEPLFNAPISYVVGYWPDDVAIGDFNGDGHLDLAVANFWSHDLTILAGNGDGTYKSIYQWFPFIPRDDSFPVALTTLNFNGDGYADLAMVDEGLEEVSFFFGDETYPFYDGTGFNVGSKPSSITAADFNGDGQVDLAVTNSDSNNITCFCGTGTTSYPVGNNPQSVTPGDFNEDGNIDIAVANHDSDNLSILLNSGDGTFNDAVFYTTGQDPSGVVSADFNEDGHLDLAVSADQASILLGAGDGTFTSELIGNFYISPSVVGDFNEDGHMDLAVKSGGGKVLLGVGDGTFNIIDNPGLEGFPSGAGDFNEDGHLDLVYPKPNNPYTNGTVSIILGNGDGTFPDAESYSTEDLYPTSVSVGDFNEDNNMDLAVTNDYQGTVSILTGNGSGLFTAGCLYDVGCGPQSSAVGDFNEDGYQDLAVGNGSSTYISVLLGVGDGTFASAVNYSAGGSSHIVLTEDFNEDGYADLAFGSSDTVYVMIGTGDGSFETSVGYGVSNSPSMILTGDFNDDGHIDIAGTITASDEVSVLPGIGDGTFGLAISTGVDNLSGSATTGDFNEDGYTDLAVSKAYPDFIDNVSILLGQGDGTFNESSEYRIGISTWGIIAEDFDGDSHMDIATANAISQNISILMGRGDGTFGGTVGYSVGDFPSFVTPGDFNNDDRPDLAVPLYEDDVVTILLNISEGGTATMLSSYLCSPVDDGIEISWTISESGEDMSFSIYRETDGSGAFLPIDAEIEKTSDLTYRAVDRNCRPGNSYRYRVDLTEGEGNRTLFTTEAVTAEAPELALSQNYPNPFNPSTTIYYSLPDRCHITLDIFDVSGRRIARLADGIQEAGTHEVKWSGLNKNGSSVSSGVYLYKLTAGKNSITRKMVLMR